MEARDSEDRHLISPFLSTSFNQSFLRKAVERREPTISFLLQLHARPLASSMPTAGARFMEVRDSEDRHLISPFLSTSFNQSFLRKAVERREPTISFLLQLHARPLASSMPTAGARFMEVRDSEDRQPSAFLSQSMIIKRIRGAAGTDYCNLFTTACPSFGTFSAEGNCKESNPCRHITCGNTWR
ncbi:hypothetical protein [Ignatzschineria cameli]|uniref:hypothetical protein n=1 Tax=Ignatzschineria cameli TaxID=2182793 RepID=UPI0010580BA4|nr:hypothetical protein [Ignatzschineria cameli]